MAKRKCPKCVTPNCGNEADGTRGNCDPCTQTYNRQIREGKVTDEWLVKKGWRLPKRPPGRLTAATKAIAGLK